MRFNRLFLLGNRTNATVVFLYLLCADIIIWYRLTALFLRLSSVCAGAEFWDALQARGIASPHQDGDEAALTINAKGNRHRTIGIHFAATEAISEYIGKAGLESGPLFRARRAPRADELGE